MDVIASTAFGMKIDSHNDPENQFVKMGRKTFDFQFNSPGVILLSEYHIFYYSASFNTLMYVYII